VFRFLNYIQKIIPYAKSIKHHIAYLVPILELVVWIVYAMWCLEAMYRIENYSGLIMISFILVLFAIPARFLMRDFLNGIFLKVQRKIDVGDYIQLEGIEGKIKHAGHFRLEIQTQQGDIRAIPYGLIGLGIISKPGNNLNLNKRLLVFRLPDSFNIEMLLPELEKALMNTPWVAVSQPPIIETVTHENGEHIIEVLVFTLKKEHSDKISKMVEKNFRSDNTG